MDYITYIHDQYMDEYDRMMKQDEIVKKEQERRKQVALTKLESLISPDLSVFFGKILIEAYMEGSNDADIIIDACKLDKNDLRALRDDDQYIYSDLMAERQREEDNEYYAECYG